MYGSLSFVLSELNNSFAFFVAGLCLLLSNSVLASDEVNTEDQVALHGYDVVTYFSGSPRAGDKDIYSTDGEIKYYFSSQLNKKKFDQNPQQFKPMYGGYCAYGVRMGKKLDNDPLAYEIKDNHLYVMLNRATYKMWTRDKKENIQISDRMWQKIHSESKASLN